MSQEPIRPLSTGMRWMLVVASALVFIVGIQLFIFTERTAEYFAWTIPVHLTGAFLGAAYWASCAMEFLASRQPTWTRARIAVPAVLTFTALTFVVTMIHLDRFHLGSEFDIRTQIVTWVWIAVYALVPIIMSGLWVQQMRVPGREAPRQFPLPLWVRAILGTHAAIMLPLGVLFLFVPEDTLSVWPWALTPLTARAIGAWLLGLGTAAAHATWENDWERVGVATSTYVVLGVLEIIALLRYSDDMQWDKPGAYVYLIFLISMLLSGIYGWWTVRNLPQRA